MSLIRSILKRISKSKANLNVLPTSTLELKKVLADRVVTLQVDPVKFECWVKEHQPNALLAFPELKHKKWLELYTSWQLLGIKSTDVYMDAAGGKYSYISTVNCAGKIMQDINFAEELKKSASKDVRFLLSPSDAIDAPDESIDKISCHHSIEHFQGDADIGFINEVQRILKPKGRCVIVPVFISDKHYLISDKMDFSFWEEEGIILKDRLAGLPGGKRSGNFSRVYNLETLQKRLLSQIDTRVFDYRIHVLEMDGNEVPSDANFYLPQQARINCSYRALEIWRR